VAQRVVGVGTKLGDSTVYANRGDPDHVQAMAVLAYTNKGDGFVLVDARNFSPPFKRIDEIATEGDMALKCAGPARPAFAPKPTFSSQNATSFITASCTAGCTACCW
jgi:hypothetical protein